MHILPVKSGEKTLRVGSCNKLSLRRLLIVDGQNMLSSLHFLGGSRGFGTRVKNLNSDFPQTISNLSFTKTKAAMKCWDMSTVTLHDQERHTHNLA